MIRVMQIGYGYWGNNVAKKLVASKLLELVALVETDEQKRGRAKSQLPGEIEILSSYEEMLASPKIDAVVICTQTEYSFEIAMAAMEHGKHIFIEKPVAKNVELARRLIAKADEKNLILHCDHLMVYNPVIRYIKRMIDSGEIGDIMYIDISRINLGPIRKDINALLDLAVHDIAVIDYFMDGLTPNELSAYGTKFFGKQETITYLTMKCGDVLININSSWVSPVKTRQMVVAGTKKMLVFDDVKMDDKLTIYDSGIDVVQGNVYGEYEFSTRVGDIHMPHINFEESLQNSLEHFAGCVEAGRTSLSGPEQCLRVMKALEWAQESLQNNRQ